MPDKFQQMIGRADLMFQQPNTARILVSWDHKANDFALHNLTDKGATADYWDNWELDPMFFIVSAHMQVLRDPAVQEIIAKTWFSILDTVSMPPCITAVTLPIPPPTGETQP